mmetsp:Transcript_39046/g.91169  ORF Transcript_39046/g.91169 Transcript_39046/m.91169 type:complete len:262 (-) Transcript_39046:528-1313(-)
MQVTSVAHAVAELDVAAVPLVRLVRCDASQEQLDLAHVLAAAHVLRPLRVKPQVQAHVAVPRGIVARDGGIHAVLDPHDHNILVVADGLEAHVQVLDPLEDDGVARDVHQVGYIILVPAGALLNRPPDALYTRPLDVNRRTPRLVSADKAACPPAVVHADEQAVRDLPPLPHLVAQQSLQYGGLGVQMIEALHWAAVHLELPRDLVDTLRHHVPRPLQEHDLLAQRLENLSLLADHVLPYVVIGLLVRPRQLAAVPLHPVV